MSVAEAAEVLGVNPKTIQRALADEERRAAEWGAEGEGWRHRPAIRRVAYQLRSELVRSKAAEQ